MTEAYQQVIEVLEHRYYGEPVKNAQLITHAINHAAFTEVWLSHAIASDASTQELAVTLILAAWHHLSCLEVLIHYWQVEEQEVIVLESDFHLQLAPFVDLFPFDLYNELHTSEPKVSSLSIEMPKLMTLWRKISQCQTSVSAMAADETLRLAKLSTDVQWLSYMPRILQNNFSKAGVYGITSSSEKQTDIRDCGQYICALPQKDVIFASFERQVAAITYQRLIHAEPLVILRYLPSEQFKWHCDFITSTNQHAVDELKMFGQRVYTSISYLNDDFTGGETEFKFWHRQIKPLQGLVLSFSNCDQQGQVDKNSAHRGCPVLTGTKFVATSWYRSKRLWHREALMTPMAENGTKR